MSAREGADGQDFFVAGGTLRRDAPSYVTRQADDDLYHALLRGELCYVLTSRQMGKSSLMVRTAARLREEGVAVAVLDLTRYGKTLSMEQWYFALLTRIGEELDLEDECEDFWQANLAHAPLIRFFSALREVVLEKKSGKVILFFDEIDVTLSLPFDTDEFFAALRELVNRRVEDPQLLRLSIGLFGVASPADLIQDPRITPFNIGTRIELRDFTPEEATPFAQRLNHGGHGERRGNHGEHGGHGEKLLKRILYWTNGHPYLTQRLCRALDEYTAENPHSKIENRDIDRFVQVRFLDSKVRQHEDNLRFVSDQLLRRDMDLHALLSLYGKIRRGERVADKDSDPMMTILRLSGIVRREGEYLNVRNRIYAHVFNKSWIEEHSTEAEIFRQRDAYRRGKVWGIAALFICITSSLILYFIYGVVRDQYVTVTLYTYDVAGREVAAKLLGQNGIYEQRTGDACLLTRSVGSTLDMAIQPIDANRYGGQRTVKLKWMSETEYNQWLEKELPVTLFKLKADTARWIPIITRLKNRQGHTKYIYPIIFEERK